MCFEELAHVCMNIVDFNGVYAYYGIFSGVLLCKKCKRHNVHKYLVQEGEPLGFLWCLDYLTVFHDVNCVLRHTWIILTVFLCYSVVWRLDYLMVSLCYGVL